MIERARLVQRWKGVSDEEALAARLNSYLGDKWPAPPYTADQWQTLRVVLELAGD